MKRVNFFSGQQVQQEDMSYLQNSLCDEIKSRTSIQYSKGVVSPVAAYVGVDLNQTLRIYPFRAYTESGEQIVVPSDIRKLALDLTDDSNRQLGTQGFLEDEYFGWRSDTPYLIVARYNEEAARPRPHYRTREPFASRIYGGFKFFAMREGIDSLEVNGINPYIILARAIYTDNRLIVTTSGVTEYAGLDASRVSVSVGTNTTQVYDIKSPVSVDEHIRSVGDITKVSAKNPHGITAEVLGLDTNAVPDHERIFHAPGFIGDASSVNSCFYTSVDARSLGVDLLVVKNLRTGDNLHYEGNTITSFIYNTDAISISFSDDSGIWPDGTYTLYANLKTREIGVATDNQTVVSDRKFQIIYDQTVQYVVSPISLSSLDASYQYVLYTLTFKQEKAYTEIDLQGQGRNLSNFITMKDHRVFGSISASNLQRNADGDFVTSFPLKTTAVKFMDGSILSTATSYTPGYIDKSLRLYYNSETSITVGTGVCKDSTNTVVLSFPTDMTKNLSPEWARGANQGCRAPGVAFGAGTWHIFVIGTLDGVTDIGMDNNLNASNLVNGDTNYSSPIEGYRYYRRIGSIYVYRDTSTNTYKIREFVTIPDSGNGVTTVYTENPSAKYLITVSGSDTLLPVPSMYTTGSSAVYGYVKAKLNITSTGSAYFMEYLPKSEASAYGLVPMQHTLGTGDVEISTYNGKVRFSNNNWSGNVISYYDPRNV